MSPQLLKQHKSSLSAMKEKNLMQPKKPQPRFTPVVREQSPLFEPEHPPVQDSVQVPVAVMVAPAPTPTSALVDEPAPPGAPSFLKQLQEIELAAKAEMAAWDPKYLVQDPDPVPGISQVSVKRKAADLDSDSSDDDDDDDDDSDSDDGEEDVPPYEPSHQIRPRLLIYHPGFKLAENITDKVMRMFTQFISKSMLDGYKDEEAIRLRNEIIRKMKINYQDAVRLAVAGDTGVGKSALLNALLGVLNLTIESDSGGACTCVITEFRQSKPTQGTPYAAEVKFFCLEVCKNLVKGLFSQWYHVKAKQRENPDDVDDVELSQMSTARDCLQELFADRLEFGSAEMFMGTATSAKDPKVVNQLMNWTSEIHQQFIKDGETSVHFEASTPEELTEQYHPFTRSVPNASYDGKPLRFTPWPLVEVVQVSLASPILAQNVIIADVPGVSDVNYFRVQNAAEYLQKCSTTIVVGKIDRLQDNVGFRQQYLEAYRRRRSGSVILVATRSDDLNDENGSTLVLDSTTESLMTTIKEKLLDIENRIKLTVNEMDANKLNKKIKANKALRKQKKKLMSRKNALEKQRKCIRIAHRSKQVSRIVGLNYRADTGDDAGAPVFCVSNRMYMRHLRGYDMDNDQSVPTMTIEETQIPSLVSHIFTLPSKGRMATLDHFVRVSIQTLLSVIQMSCSASTLTRVKHLVDIVQRSRDDLDTSISDLATKFMKTDVKNLEDELAHHDLQSRFDIQATAKLTKWETLPAGTHRAVCNKQGTHVLKKRGINLHWNEDLMSPMRPAIDQIFRKILDESCDIFQAKAAQTIKNALNELDNTLKDDPKALAADAYKLCLESNKGRYVEDISRQVVAAAKVLKDGLIKVHMRAVRVGREDYFCEAMLDIYAEAAEIKGSGRGMTMMVSRCKYLQEAIPGPTGPFNNISGWVEEDASKVVKEVEESLKKEADEVFLQIQNNFRAMKKRKENDTPEGKRFRTELHELVAEARRIMDGVGTEALDACKQYK
ncbi:hypothetical protein E8E12_006678 [Didymella heteroderae]|uniref:GTPase n=1 Tax=Didymella heteroderae TaxID=1769908 RepID=A0A9P4WJU1_9PLEO|nr:hypothetical protein E8E12_006678 [Didymella heteroderae]